MPGSMVIIKLGDCMFGKDKKKKSGITNSEKSSNANKTKELGKSIEDNIDLVNSIFSNDETLIVRRFQNKFLKTAKCCIFYFEGMIDYEVVNESVIKPVLDNNLSQYISDNNLLEELQNKVLANNYVRAKKNINNVVDALVRGETVFFLDGYDEALIIKINGWKKRAVSEPESERVVRGPREGFIESVETNLVLIRRRIKTPEFKTKFREIGERTRTKVCICYIDDIVSKSILSELERRLDEINIDGILDSGYIQELIRDEPFSFFETVGYSERPDVVVSRLLEGRIAIIVDGSPAVLTVPFILLEHAQSNEDYYNNYILATFNRLIRTTATISSMTIPAVYLAVVTYHQEMLPTPVLLSLSASRQGVPFPTSLSFFIMLLIFDVLRETGARMPLSIGQAINVVGALVLGEAAINAKLVSAPVVVITALSGILTLLNSRLLTPIIFLRFFLLLVASVLGLYGVIFGFMIIILHLASMRSFGVPYLLGVTRIMHHDGQDAWIRAPWWTMTLRPKIIAARNLVRETVGKNRRR
jgi:spore germination protein KA